MKKQLERDDLMLRTRAAVAYVNGRGSEEVKLAAFMALFHPEDEGRSAKKQGIPDKAD